MRSLQNLIEAFSAKTDSFPADFEETKHYYQWSLNYNIIKIQFVLTKKERLMCPASTLFCRIYLGKNDVVYFHIPEIIDYLDEQDFKCYYFSYIESDERLERCFEVLEAFLLKHLDKIRAIAQSEDLSKALIDRKVEEIYRIADIKDGTEEELRYRVDAFERFLLLPRLAGDYAYRDFMRGNYKKALQIYQKAVSKNECIAYEKRLYEFIATLTEPYETIPKECASVLEMEKYSGAKAEGITILKGLALGEIIFGGVMAVILFLINTFVSKGTILYIGTEWYWGLVIGFIPALFGAIALRMTWAKILNPKEYQKAVEYDVLVNGKFVNQFSKITFVLSILAAMFFFVQFLTCDTAFYEDHMWYGAGDVFISAKKTTCDYENLEEVIYSEGVYNDFGDYIDRPSYLLVFSDGHVWDSDGFTTIEKVEEEILPILASYYEEIRTVESRNEYIE